jgi:hypothetical protein
MIALGKRADLPLVRGDPTRDITATRDIVSVWKLGAEDDRASYRASIEKAKEEAVKTAQTPPSELGTGLSEISKKRASPLSLAPDGRSRATHCRWKIQCGQMKITDGGTEGGKHALESSGVIEGASLR